MKKLLFCTSIALCALAAALASPSRVAQTPDDAALTTEIKKARDDVDPAKVTQLADVHTRTTLDGLLECYDSFSSIYMKLYTLRTLSVFDAVPEAQQPAL